jgi:hypothetical protein
MTVNETQLTSSNNKDLESSKTQANNQSFLTENQSSLDSRRKSIELADEITPKDIRR